MPLLTREPGHAIPSLDEVLAIAAAMEAQAVALYRSLGEEMARQGSEAAAVFHRLVAIEQAHLESVGAWSQAALGAPPPRSTAGEADVWASVTQPTADESATSLLTPYRALSIAVRMEERAFAFYTYIASDAQDDAVRRTAEALAREELRHAAELRVERRKAYRLERGLEGTGSIPIPETVAALAALALVLEGGIAAALTKSRGGVERERGAGDDSGAAILATVAARLTGRHAERQALAVGQVWPAAAAAMIGTPPKPAGLPAITEALYAAVRLLESLCDTYETIAEHSSDEQVMIAALGFSETALSDLALVRQRLMALDPGLGDRSHFTQG